MSVRKRGKAYQIDYIDVSGKRVRKSGFKTKEDAKQAEAKLLVDVAKGISTIQNKIITFKVASEHYINTQLKNYCKESTYDEYKRMINTHLVPFFGDMRLINIKKNTIEDFITYQKNNTNVCDNTINKHLTILSAILEKQVENENLYINYARRVKKLPIEQKETRALTKKEIGIILNICKKDYEQFLPLLYTAINTGLRKGEILALRWQNINFKEELIKVQHSLYKGKLTTPKSKTSKRSINMSKSLKKVLLELKLETSGKDENFVFTNSNNGALDSKNIINRFYKPLIKKSDIGHVRFHDLRHTFASQLITNGVDIKYIQTQLGHASTRMTLDTYGHLLPDSNEKALKVLDNLCLFPEIVKASEQNNA